MISNKDSLIKGLSIFANSKDPLFPYEDSIFSRSSITLKSINNFETWFINFIKHGDLEKNYNSLKDLQTELTVELDNDIQEYLESVLNDFERNDSYCLIIYLLEKFTEYVEINVTLDKIRLLFIYVLWLRIKSTFKESKTRRPSNVQSQRRC